MTGSIDGRAEQQYIHTSRCGFPGPPPGKKEKPRSSWNGTYFGRIPRSPVSLRAVSGGNGRRRSCIGTVRLAAGTEQQAAGTTARQLRHPPDREGEERKKRVKDECAQTAHALGAGAAILSAMTQRQHGESWAKRSDARLLTSGVPVSQDRWIAPSSGSLRKKPKTCSCIYWKKDE